jgi:glutathione S-transferase
MPIHFYYSPMSSSNRVHWALEELGVPYEKHRLDLMKGDQKKPDFLAINPNGKIPALVDGDAKVFESHAILTWLGERYGEEKSLWPKAGTPERADAYSWSTWAIVNLLPAIFTYALHANDDARFVLPKEKRSTHVADASKESYESLMKILDARLNGRDFILGKNFSLADVAVVTMAMVAPMLAKLSIDAYPNVQAWVGRCMARPALGRVMSER